MPGEGTAPAASAQRLLSAHATWSHPLTSVLFARYQEDMARKRSPDQASPSERARPSSSRKRGREDGDADEPAAQRSPPGSPREGADRCDMVSMPGESSAIASITSPGLSPIRATEPSRAEPSRTIQAVPRLERERGGATARWRVLGGCAGRAAWRISGAPGVPQLGNGRGSGRHCWRTWPSRQALRTLCAVARRRQQLHARCKLTAPRAGRAPG